MVRCAQDRGRRAALLLVLVSLAACAGSAPLASHTATAPLAPPTSWSATGSLAPPELGGAVFGGPGNQFAMAATAYRVGFVVVGEDFQSDQDVTGRIWTSIDGTSWEIATGPGGVFSSSEVDQVAVAGQRAVAFGEARSGEMASAPQRILWLSDDGRSWRRIAAGAAVLETIKVGGLASTGSGFVVWGETASGSPTIATSTDGETWATSDIAAQFPDAVVASVAVGGGVWVAVGSKRSATPAVGGPARPAEAFVSTDGQRWSAASVDGPALTRVVSGSDGFLAEGASQCGSCVGPGNIWHSDDGRTWRLVGPDATTSASYASDGVRIVRLGLDGGVSLDWSTDGLTWQPLASGLAAHSEYGAFAVGPNGVLLLENPSGLGNGTGGLDDADAGVWYVRPG